MHLYLIGYRATGKTTIAQELSRILGRPALDLDQFITEHSRQTIAEIFEQSGEAGFREIESRLLGDVVRQSPAVISLGGGTILNEANRDLIADTGKSVWLRASSQNVLERMSGDPNNLDNRPALTNHPLLEEVEQQLAERTPIYSACADYTIDTDHHTPQQLAEQISIWWESVDTNNRSD